VPEDTRIALERLRKIIKAAAPGTTEVVNYKIPIFKYQGHPLVGFGATKNHCSFYVMTSSMIPKLAQARDTKLKEFDVNGATIHFTPDTPLPAAFVTKLVKERLVDSERGAKKRV
jgi:uncharacterized protein YdhG (YjbR/CyaY superfamily)